jgi:Zn-dependent peptidase ImmA (M78 family)/DNA-binding XRE family transcriptional regulator
MPQDATAQHGFNAERLTLARMRRSLTKAELGRLVGRVPRTISDYEASRTEPDDQTVERLASVLQFPVAFFFQPLRTPMPKDTASFRALTKKTAKQANAALAVGTLGIALNEWIEERFDLPDPDVPDLQPGIINPEGAAALVRSRWDLGLSPISNVLHLLEFHGVRVFSLADECREIDAFSAWVGPTPYVCLATHKTAERAIFDAAHELGHLVLHRDHASPRGRREEREADQFASCLLMPTDDVESSAPMNPTLSDLISAKSRWRVSAAALNYRLHDLKFTSDWRYRELCMEIGQFRGYEPNSVQREHSQVLTKVFATMREEGTTRKDIADALLLFPDDLDAITFGLSTTVLDGSGESTPRRRDHLRLI